MNIYIIFMNNEIGLLQTNTRLIQHPGDVPMKGHVSGLQEPLGVHSRYK